MCLVSFDMLSVTAEVKWQKKKYIGLQLQLVLGCISTEMHVLATVVLELFIN